MKSMELQIDGKMKTFTPEEIKNKINEICKDIDNNPFFNSLYEDIDFIVQAFNTLDDQYRELELQNQDLPY